MGDLKNKKKHFNPHVWHLPCLSPQRHSDQGMTVCSVRPSLFPSPPGKTATWPQSRTSSPDTLPVECIITLITAISWWSCFLRSECTHIPNWENKWLDFIWLAYCQDILKLTKERHTTISTIYFILSYFIQPLHYIVKGNLKILVHYI